MRMLTSIIIVIFQLLLIAQTEKPWDGVSLDFRHGKLKVSENKRSLEFEDGTPFFYLGDTAWELFHRLNYKESEVYLENRREKGFTVIQAVVLAELEGLHTPNRSGELPLYNNNPQKPNEKYFAYVDSVIKLAESKGIFIGLLPTWGDKVDLESWGKGPVIFNEDNAYKYGKWIGNRYKNFTNIIWIIGGDRSGGGGNFPIWNALAEGVKSEDRNHLMTFHPIGGTSSSFWFHNTEWLDFNMVQTGHCERTFSVYKRIIKQDFEKVPIKPVLDGEPRYENHPVCWKPQELGWFDDADVRQAAYWSLFSGSFGHSYGCHSVWQFLSNGILPIGFARNNWLEDLDLPGAWDMINVRRLLESRNFNKNIPAQELIKDEYISETDFVAASKGDGSALIYIPTGYEVKVKLDLLGFKNIKAWWYNPRNGESNVIGVFSQTAIQNFSAPTQGRGNDWILVLDDLSRNFDEPGK